MKKTGASRAVVFSITLALVAGILALVLMAPLVVTAAVFLILAATSAIYLGKKEGRWKGFVAFAKDMIFGW